MDNPRPRRQQSDLAEMLEMLLDKGVVINADIAVTVGETELLGIKLRAAVASFETAAKYGLEFPTGTDMARVEEAAGVEAIDLDEGEREQLELDTAEDEEEQEEREEAAAVEVEAAEEEADDGD